ncbi:hypothetical protein B9Z55_028000 [Caenorhabditis nigoni]|nr:hypothetical protein B9Z55_028000 [Caenorhabditis nigoni]
MLLEMIFHLNQTIKWMENKTSNPEVEENSSGPMNGNVEPLGFKSPDYLFAGFFDKFFPNKTCYSFEGIRFNVSYGKEDKSGKATLKNRMSSFCGRQNEYIQRVWGRLTSRSGTTQITPAPMDHVHRHGMTLLHEACSRLLKTIQQDKESRKKWNRKRKKTYFSVIRGQRNIQFEEGLKWCTQRMEQVIWKNAHSAPGPDFFTPQLQQTQKD